MGTFVWDEERRALEKNAGRASFTSSPPFRLQHEIISVHFQSHSGGLNSKGSKYSVFPGNWFEGLDQPMVTNFPRFFSSNFATDMLRRQRPSIVSLPLRGINYMTVVHG